MTRITLLFLLIFPLLATTVDAAAIMPCTDALTMDIIPLSNGVATYCVSDYGWTDTWFVGSSPAKYDPVFDVLSGDDSPNLHFGIAGVGDWHAGSGFGWITPIMDGGTLTPSILTGSPWMVVTGVHHTGPTTAESLVHHPLGIDARIVTSLDPAGQEVTQSFTFTNTTTGTTFTDLLFADYFNYHPNGTTSANALKGTVTYDPLSGITITGPNDGTLIGNGSMRGERVDDMHGRNGPFLTLPIDVMDMVQTQDYHDPGPGVAVGPGNVAGALAWNLGDLGPGESVDFTISKLSDPLTVPEPRSVLLLSLVLAGLGFSRVRLRHAFGLSTAFRNYGNVSLNTKTRRHKGTKKARDQRS